MVFFVFVPISFIGTIFLYHLTTDVISPDTQHATT